ncbi:hypothetical protein NPIL_506681 [Nephila pilipes]|uniref:Uncharacterized protein n=1 Tax=Nephila pilipes TaxID=299642 RepID=A0A8X6UFJ9_NEPPI|nr:hypothetical protein NPIL_506681 [Nephila pilipes]
MNTFRIRITNQSTPKHSKRTISEANWTSNRIIHLYCVHQQNFASGTNHFNLSTGSDETKSSWNSLIQIKSVLKDKERQLDKDGVDRNLIDGSLRLAGKNITTVSLICSGNEIKHLLAVTNVLSDAIKNDDDDDGDGSFGLMRNFKRSV